MNSLYDRIETNDKFTADKDGMPVVDRSAQAAFGLDWAQRQQTRPQPPPDPVKMTPIVPMAN